jgi:hypothetical protein
MKGISINPVCFAGFLKAVLQGSRTPLGLLALVLLSACSSSEAVKTCLSKGDFIVHCGIALPEDLAVLPEAKGVLISELGALEKEPGRLSLFTTASASLDSSYRVLYELKQDEPEGAKTEGLQAESSLAGNWGEPLCQPEALFSPHGIHLSQRGDSWQLLVVNHGDVEQVQFFEVQLQPEVSLQFRGCVNFPEPAYLNDVVALPDGGFAVTHMMAKDKVAWGQLKGMLGLDTGFVWRWSPQNGLRQIAHSEGGMPNGIESDATGEHLFINMYMSNRVDKLRLSDERVLASIEVSSPDNSSWSASGELVVASHTAGIQAMLDCFEVRTGSCGAAFDLLAIEPASMKQSTLYRHPGGGEFGAATIAVQHQGQWILGSFSGDRVAIMKADRL